MAAPFVIRLDTSSALAQSRNTWSALSGLSDEAQRLGLSVPRMGLAPAAAPEKFSEIQPAIVDFMDSVSGSAPDAPSATSADVDSLLERASELLRTNRNAERAPRDIPEGPQAAAVTAPAFDAIADDYRKLTRSKKGISGRAKLAGQIAIAAVAVIYLFYSDCYDPDLKLRLSLPLVDFYKHPITLWMPVYMAFAIIVIVGASNGVNMTDGLDGLAIGPVIISAGTFLILAISPPGKTASRPTTMSSMPP